MFVTNRRELLAKSWVLIHAMTIVRLIVNGNILHAHEKCL